MSAPLHCSMAQALDVYADVAMAWAGCNGFGGNTAQIYAYRLWPYCSTIGRDGIVEHLERAGSIYHDDAVSMEANGRADLATICRHAEEHLGGKVTIYDAPIDEWESWEGFAFSHRAEVCFERCDGDAAVEHPGEQEPMGFGDALRQARVLRGLSQRALSSKAGYSPPVVSLLEGEKSKPSFRMVGRLCDALRVNFSVGAAGWSWEPVVDGGGP